MTKYISMRIRRNDWKPNKTAKIFYKSISQQIAHDLRTEKIEEGYLAHPELQDQNINKTYCDLDDDFLMSKWEGYKASYFERWGRALPKNTKPTLTGLISFSSTFRKDLEVYGVERVSELVNDFLRLKFGDALLYCSFQLDEITPHFQFMTMNLNSKTNKTFSNQMDTSKLQDEVADYLKKYIPNFEYIRGVNKKQSKAEHIEVRQSQSIALEKAKEEQKALTLEMATVKKEKEIITKEVETLKSNYHQLEKDIQELREINQDLSDDRLSLMAELKELCDDLVVAGEEMKAESFLESGMKWLSQNKTIKFDKVLTRARKTRDAMLRNQEQREAEDRARGSNNNNRSPKM